MIRTSSVFWSSVRNLGQRLGTVATFFLLARVLSPAEIGTFAAAAAFIALLEVLADNGLGDATIQANQLTSRVATAVLLVNVAIATMLYISVCLFSSSIGPILGVKGMEDILRVAAIVLVLNASGYVPQAILRKEFEFKRLAFRTLASAMAGATTGLSMAVLGFGVWSMVAQLIVTALMNAALAWYPLVLRITIPDFRGARPLMLFGLHVFASRIFHFFSSSYLIELIIPGSFGLTALGLYFLASRVPSVLAQIISNVTVDVSLPHFSKLASSDKELNHSFFANMELLAAIATPAFLGLGALAPEVTRVAFGANGAGSETLMVPIAVLGAIRAVGYYDHIVLVGCGYPHIVMRILFINASLTLALLLALRNTNIVAFVYGYASLQSLMVVIGFFLRARYTALPLKRTLLTCAPFLVAGSLALGLVTILRWYVKDYVEIALLRGAGLGIIFLAMYFLVLVVIDQKALRRVLDRILMRSKQKIPDIRSQ